MNTQELPTHRLAALRAELDRLDGMMLGIEAIQHNLGFEMLHLSVRRLWFGVLEAAVIVAFVVALVHGQIMLAWAISIIAFVILALWLLRLIDEKVISGEWQRVMSKRLHCCELLSEAEAATGEVVSTER